MKQNIIETIVGFVVLFVAVGFFIYAYKDSGAKEDLGGYFINATFQNAEGISKGSDIMISGIKVGVVESLVLDKESYLARMTLRIQDNVKVPSDSSASIVSQSLLGGKYVLIIPGANDESLAVNGSIQHTQSSINFESLIGKVMFSKASASDAKN